MTIDTSVVPAVLGVGGLIFQAGVAYAVVMHLRATTATHAEAIKEIGGKLESHAREEREDVGRLKDRLTAQETFCHATHRRAAFRENG